MGRPSAEKSGGALLHQASAQALPASMTEKPIALLSFICYPFVPGRYFRFCEYATRSFRVDFALRAVSQTAMPNAAIFLYSVARPMPIFSAASATRPPLARSASER